MANTTQSNPVYYSLGSLNSSSNSSSTRTVILHRRPDHEGFGVYIGEDVPSGLYIVTVERNSPAAEANIQPGDRVIAFNGQPVASIQHNPKEKLMEAAANSHSLSLTIKSTDLYHSLQLPLVNSSKTDNNQNQNQNQNVRHYTSNHTINPSIDLEGYVRSLFADQNIQILQAGTEQDLKAPAIPPRRSMEHPKSLPPHHESKKSHRSHRARREHSKRVTLVSVETQTSIGNDENKYRERSDQSSTKRNGASRPNMGVNHIVSKNQTNNSTDNQKNENRTSEQGKSSEFTGISPSSSSEEESLSMVKSTQSRPPGHEVKNVPNSTISNSKTSANQTMTHVADVVVAAMNRHASQNNQNPGNRTQASTSQKNEANKQSATTYTTVEGFDQPQPFGQDQPPLGGRDKPQPFEREQPPSGGRDQPQAFGRDQPPSGGRDQAQPFGQDQPPSSGRDKPQPFGQDQAPSNGRDKPQPFGRDQPASGGRDQPPSGGRDQPPPYTEMPNKPVPVSNQPSANEGSYHVPTGEMNQRTKAPSSGDETVRDLHLVRQANFQGFGFHIQYNKKYYLIQSVEDNSPAAVAGLQPNDVILYINGDKTDNMAHATFVQIVNSHQAIDFSVQPLNDYLRANPSAARNQSTTAAQALTNQVDDKSKSSISKALGKFSAR